MNEKGMQKREKREKREGESGRRVETRKEESGSRQERRDKRQGGGGECGRGHRQGEQTNRRKDRMRALILIQQR